MKTDLQLKKKTKTGNSTKRNIWAGLGVTFALVIAFFLFWPSQKEGQTEAVGIGVPGVELSEEMGIELGQIAPDFTISTLDGSSFKLTDNSEKPTVILFMAYWCGSCILEARALAQLQEEYKEEVRIIAIDVDPTSTPQLLGRFSEDADGGSYIWGFDTGQQVTFAYEVQALDTTIVIDGDGHIVYRDASITTYSQLKTILGQLGL